VLINQDRVAVGVHYDETGRSRGVLIGFAGELDPLRLQVALDVAHIGERHQPLGVLAPARIEGQDVPVEHALQQTDHVLTVLQDQPVLGEGSAEDLEAERFIERFRCLDVFDRKAD